MSGSAQTGMDKAEMKKLLMRSKQEPVNCAIGQGNDPSLGLLLLHKVKQPKALEKEVKELPGAKNTRFGTAVVDTDADPKLVTIYVNTKVSGLARKLVKTLKGTGFNKVEIRVGNPAESELADGYSEDETADTAAPAALADAAPTPDLADLKSRLALLIPRVSQLDAADPRKADLVGQARRAGAMLQANDLAGAAGALDALEQGLAATQAAAQAANGANGDYEKYSTIWLATRKRVQDEVAALRRSILAAYQGQPYVGDIEKRFTDRTAPLLQAFDGALSETLDAAKTAPAADRDKLVAQAKTILTRYEVASGDPLLAELDANPFQPVAIQKTVAATLSALAKSLR